MIWNGHSSLEDYPTGPAQLLGTCWYHLDWLLHIRFYKLGFRISNRILGGRWDANKESRCTGGFWRNTRLFLTRHTSLTIFGLNFGLLVEGRGFIVNVLRWQSWQLSKLIVTVEFWHLECDLLCVSSVSCA